MSDNITVSVTTPPTTQLSKKAADYAYLVARLAAEKAVASKAKPALYTLPVAANSMEHLFRTRFDRLSQPKQQGAAGRVMPEVTTISNARKRFLGNLASIDLKAATPIDEQARSLIVRGNFQIPRDLPSGMPGGPRPAAAIVHKKLALRLHRVKCVDETNAWWPIGETGSDEIDFGACLVDENLSGHLKSGH